MLNQLKPEDALQKKYDKLIKEAYDLSKVNYLESMKKQREAQEVQKEIFSRSL